MFKGECKLFFEQHIILNPVNSTPTYSNNCLLSVFDLQQVLVGLGMFVRSSILFSFFFLEGYVSLVLVWVTQRLDGS